MEELNEVFLKILNQVKQNNPERVENLLGDKGEINVPKLEDKWITQTVASEKCPHEVCDGTGFIHYRNPFLFKEKMVVCKCYSEKKRLKELREFSKIPKDYIELGINDFDIFIYKEKNLLQAKSIKTGAINYVKNFERMSEDGIGLFYWSKTKGAGKTLLACTLANALNKVHSSQVLFMKSSELFQKMRESIDESSNYTFREYFTLVTEVDVLIIDDLNVEKPSKWIVEKFTTILDIRMENKKITIFTANAAIKDLDFAFSTNSSEHSNDATERIQERINKMCVEIEFPNDNIRAKIAGKRNDSLANLLKPVVD